MSSVGRRSLFREVEPFSFGWMPTSGPHEIYYEECGNPRGKPCVILHGGPGGAVNPTMRRFFDPAKWRMALFDQRGCGRSRPNASLDDNTTWSLIEDIERLREHLGVEKWTVFGGSWGSTLALAYAIKHPDRVEGLVLRGIFLLTEKELRWFYQDGASMLFPDAWERFLAPIPEDERGDLMAAYHRRLVAPDRRVQLEAAAAWSQWEGDTISLRGPRRARPSSTRKTSRSPSRGSRATSSPTRASSTRTTGSSRTSTASAASRAGSSRAGSTSSPPLDSAWRLHKAWPEARFEIIWDAGHASTEPGVIDGLVRATEAALVS
ncbi:prolyl aminopeptidase [Caulobacter vibrioides]|uniref:prolyl aminopeptidase n=1 Tax=Caulobacter vibrioides TaxID=155892 RepID=UPI001E45248F|nr:prolyl aminopeptidase [Caulobacter vibrioides]